MGKVAWLLLVGILGICTPTFAQNRAPALEFSGSYSYVRVATEDISLNGGNGSVTYYPKSWFGVVGEIGAYHYSGDGETTLQTFLFGPRLAYRKHKRLVPFGQILFGGAHETSESQNAFAMDIGGGLDVTVTKHVAVRAIQMDYLETRFGQTGSGSQDQNSFRLSFGIVFRLFK